MEHLDQLVQQAAADFAAATDGAQLEHAKARYVGKSGLLTERLKALGKLDPDARREAGAAINAVKTAIEAELEGRRSALREAALQAQLAAEALDVSLPGRGASLGGLHPVSRTLERIERLFASIGFIVADGPEIETDWHNFTALNMPEDHPARDMQDTFFVQVNPDVVLRTHTSSIQVRVMENQQPPIRILSPGRVFRNETISARSHCFFHQVEGLYIDEQVSFADLLQTLDFFVKELFGKDTRIKLRPSYFPFTEPSAEVDVTCFICGGGGCNVCKHSGWVEILGCGMVDPKVLENCNIDPKKYSGFAFGMGVERITMLKYQIKDIRLLSENDTRFLSQFRAAF